jgi:hypothetical protein
MAIRLVTIAAVWLVLCVAPRTAGPPVLTVAGTRLAVDGTPRFLVFLSYFDGVRRARALVFLSYFDGVRRARAGNLDADLAFLAERVDGIRVLPNWWASTCPLRGGTDTLIDVDGRIRASVWRDLRRLLDAASAAGLLVDLSLTRETVVDEGPPHRVLAHDGYERALTELVGRDEYLKGKYPNLLVDVQNEWTRFASAAQIEQLLGRVHAADPRRVLAASVSGDRYVVTGRDIPTMIAAYHDPRGRDWFTPEVVARQVRKVSAGVRQPVYLQEPMPATTACEGQAVDREMSHFIGAADAAKASGAAAWTFHTRTAFDLSRQSLVEKLRAPVSEAERRAIDQLKGR